MVSFSTPVGTGEGRAPSRRLSVSMHTLHAGGTTYAVYSYLHAHDLPTANGKDLTAVAGSGCAFDAIARKYDTAVGSEEWAMGTLLLRK